MLALPMCIRVPQSTINACFFILDIVMLLLFEKAKTDNDRQFMIA